MKPTRRYATYLIVLAVGLGSVAPIAARAFAATPLSTMSQRIAEIDRYITEETKGGAVPGIAISITQKNDVLLAKGFGTDSLGAPVTESTPFQIASLSKSFTALAVLQLVDQGLLELDDTVVSHLPDFHLADPRGVDITVRQVLNQTSGLADSTSPDMSRIQPQSLTEAVAGLSDVRLAASPGAQWNYHNPNYEIAARLVEVVSGMPFDRYMDQHVFGPAQMDSTVTETTDSDRIPGLADGHIIVFGAAVRAHGPGYFVVGGGGVVTNAADMTTWLMLNANGGRTADGVSLVSPSSFAEWHTAQVDNGYALGWDTDGPAAAPTQLDHTGNLLTYGAAQAVFPQERLGVAVMFNSSSALQLDQVRIVNGVLSILRGQTPTPSSPFTMGTLIEIMLAIATVGGLALGTKGVRNAARWSRRRTRWSDGAIRSVPLLIPIALAALLPQVASIFYLEREVAWAGILWGWPALAIAAFSCGIASAATILARALALRGELAAD